MLHIDRNVLSAQDIPLVGNDHMLVLQSLEAPEEGKSSEGSSRNDCRIAGHQDIGIGCSEAVPDCKTASSRISSNSIDD